MIFRKKEQYHSFEKENAEGFFYERFFSTTVHDYHVDYIRHEPAENEYAKAEVGFKRLR